MKAGIQIEPDQKVLDLVCGMKLDLSHAELRTEQGGLDAQPQFDK